MHFKVALLMHSMGGRVGFLHGMRNPSMAPTQLVNRLSPLFFSIHAMILLVFTESDNSSFTTNKEGLVLVVFS